MDGTIIKCSIVNRVTDPAQCGMTIKRTLPYRRGLFPATRLGYFHFKKIPGMLVSMNCSMHPLEAVKTYALWVATVLHYIKQKSDYKKVSKGFERSGSRHLDPLARTRSPRSGSWMVSICLYHWNSVGDTSTKNVRRK
jgi:hypothetical protein